MTMTTRKPPIKETVGAQYICFNSMDENNDWTTTFETEVEKTEVVKNVSVTENADTTDVYASGKVYDSEKGTQTDDIEVEVIAFADATLAKMRGDVVDESGLIFRGGNGVRPYFAYGKVVHLKGGKSRFDWFPKCKLTENSDEAATKESSYSEQTDTLTIHAVPFNDNNDVCVSIGADNIPEGLTEDLFFSKVILTAEDLKSVIPKP